MKTNGINNVEVFDDLTQVSDEKLLKLRDVAGAYLHKTFKDYMEARDHTIAIQLELQTRGIIKPKD